LTDQPPLPPAVVDAFWQRWGSNTFLSAQGLELELAGVGRAVVHLRKPTVMQRGGGGSADVINGGVIAYMFDAALGCAIASANLARPEMRSIDARRTAPVDHQPGHQLRRCGRRPALRSPWPGRALGAQRGLCRRRAARRPGTRLRHRQGHLARHVAATGRRRPLKRLRTPSNNRSRKDLSA